MGCAVGQAGGDRGRAWQPVGSAARRPGAISVLHSTPNTCTRLCVVQDVSQKDKIMAEMKKELKKLQRLREQVSGGPAGVPAAASAD